MTTAQLAEEVWWCTSATRFPWRWSGTAEYPVLVINDFVYSLMGRVTGRKDCRGVALRAHEVVQCIVRLKRIRRLGARGKTVIDCLTGQLAQFRNIGVCLVQDGPDRRCRDRIAVHECFHLFQYRNGLHRRPTPKALLKHPATSKAIPSLRTQYDVGNAAEVVFEMAAYIFSGDHAYIGLRKREAEEWLSTYFRQYRCDPRHRGTRGRDGLWSTVASRVRNCFAEVYD